MHRKNIGIFALLAVIVLVATMMEGNFVAAANLKTLIRDTSLYGLISIGVAAVIITGGIDLSIGSLIALCGVMMVSMINVHYVRDQQEHEVVALTRAEGDQTLSERFPAAATLIELRPPPLGIRGGDRLVYEGVLGETTVYLLGAEDESQGRFATSDPARRLTEKLSVRVDRIAYNSPFLVVAAVLLMGALIGALHGVLITRAHLQPFVVTLCGLLIYRGLARVWTGDDQVGLGSALAGFKTLATGAAFEFPLPLVARLSGTSESWTQWTWIEFPVTGVLLLLVAAAAWFFLQHMVAGRHLLAVGENEQAARFSGVRTDRLIILAYVISGTLAALAGVLFLLEWNSVQPGSSGNFYELYAIAAAVLGGCSLRGGRGAVFGVIAGAAVMRCLYKAIVVLGIEQQWEMVIIGAALLASVLFDEVMGRWRMWKLRRGSGAVSN